MTTLVPLPSKPRGREGILVGYRVSAERTAVTSTSSISTSSISTPGLCLLCLATMLSAGCAPRHYQAHPIVPAESVSRLQVRSLADPGLESYIEANLGEASLGETSLGRRISPWPPKKW